MTQDIVAASYERVSTQIQSLGFSLGVQNVDAKTFAAAQRWPLPEHLMFRDGIDQDASGADWDLPDLNRMLDAAKRGEFQRLIVPHHDRFARDMVKALVLEEELRRLGAQVVYISAPTDDTPEGNLLRNQLHSISQYDREKRRLLTMRTRLAKAQQGIWVGAGVAPYGYCVVREPSLTDTRREGRVIGLAIVEEEAAVVREIFKRALRSSCRAVLSWLVDSGITPPAIGRRKDAADSWTHPTLYSILTSRLYAGTGTYKGLLIQVPKIVTVELFEDVQAALEKRNQRPGGWLSRRGSDGDVFVLRGMLVCGQCSRPGREVLLRAEGRLDARRYYACPRKFPSRMASDGIIGEQCSLPMLRADVIEDELWRMVIGAVADREAIQRDFAESQERRAAKLQQFEHRLGAIDTQVQRALRQLDRCVRRLNELEPGADNDDEIAALERDRDNTKKLLGRLRIERERVVVDTRPAGLSAEEVELFMESLAELEQADGLEAATPAERRVIFETLGIRGTVYADDQGDMQIHRRAARQARVEWTGELRLRSGNSLMKIQLILRRGRFEIEAVRRAA